MLHAIYIRGRDGNFDGLGSIVSLPSATTARQKSL
jgi:hypothetical protein